MEAKPILLVGMLFENDAHVKKVRENLESRIKDYHIICFYSDDIVFKVLNGVPPDVTDLSGLIKELTK